MISKWREYSNAVIQKAYQELQQTDPDMPIDKLCKKISKDYYPFYEREHHPYRIWLSALKQFKAQLLGTAKVSRKGSSYIDPNQPTLF